MSTITLQINLNVGDASGQEINEICDSINAFFQKNDFVPKESKSVGKRKKLSSASFLAFAEKEISRLEQNQRFSTARNYRTALSSFTKFRRGKDISLFRLSADMATDYESWLKQRGSCLNTISCYMRVLSALYNKAVDRKLVEQRYPFKRVFTGMEKTVKRAVTTEDIQQLSTLPLKRNSSLELTRNLFIFSFMARGMPYVDMAYLKREQLQGEYIVYYRHKTQQQLRIKLESRMQKIIESYYSPESEYVFPIITADDDMKAYKQYREGLCYYNKQLKQLSGMLGSECKLTSYVPRHTWASIAYQSQIELSTISKALGHYTPMTTLTYIKDLEDHVVDEANMKLLSKVLVDK
ncbi:tyrosine-type recombinase/integrase [Phocaeicola sp.]